MTQANFKLIRIEENAVDCGRPWFSNGASKQFVYYLSKDGIIITKTISTKLDVELCAIVIIGPKAVNGVEIVPMIEIIYDVKFSKSPNTKFRYGRRQLVIKLEK